MFINPYLQELAQAYGGGTAIGDTTGGMSDSLQAVGAQNPTMNPLLGASSGYGAAGAGAGGMNWAALASMIGGDMLKGAQQQPTAPRGSPLVGAGGVYMGEQNVNPLLSLQQQAHYWAQQNPQAAMGLLSQLMGKR